MAKRVRDSLTEQKTSNSNGAIIDSQKENKGLWFGIPKSKRRPASAWPALGCVGAKC